MAHAANKNQPLLGFVLLPLAFPQITKLIVTVYSVLQLGSFGVPGFSFKGIIDTFKELPARYSSFFSSVKAPNTSTTIVVDTVVTNGTNDVEMPATIVDTTIAYADTTAVATPVEPLIGDGEVVADTTSYK